MAINEMTLDEKKAEFVAFCIETYKPKSRVIFTQNIRRVEPPAFEETVCPVQ